MKKQTYDQLRAERDHLAKSESLLSLALNLALHGRADATEQTSHDGDRWKLELYGARRADGGIVIETFHHLGQRPQSAVHYLEDLVRVRPALSEGGLKYARAIERLRVVRNRIAYPRERSTVEPGAPTPLQDSPGERDAHLAGDKRDVLKPAVEQEAEAVTDRDDEQDAEQDCNSQYRGR